MDGREPDATDLAEAILDGGSIDWQNVRATANETDRALFDQLHVLATLADVHRGQRVDSDDTRRSWGHLRVLEPIGSGSFGQVYRAWDTRLDREVALKLLPAPPDAGEARASSIIQEGRLLARIHHPNVVTIYGADRIGDTIGLWMERVDGDTVEQRIVQGPPLQPTEAVRIGIQICHAVSAVHRAGLLHRDIKAQNVMLAKDGRAVLMDFGTGWEVGDGPAQVESLAGTPLYLAPELLCGGCPTIQTDVYSLGVLLHHMLTGTFPVRASTLRDLRLAHEREAQTAVASERTTIAPRLGRIIERAIDRRPERRYDTADALAADLALVAPHRSALRSKYMLVAAALLVLGEWLWVDGYRRVRIDTATHEIASRGPLYAGDAPAIAVLPLTNISKESGSEDFVDGLTEEIIDSLAATEHLRVRSRASCFAFKAGPHDLGKVARQLDVGLALEGSAGRSGGRFEVAVRLVRAPSGAIVWTDRAEGGLGEVFAIRDRITRGVIGSIGFTPVRAARRYDGNADAYGRYLTARALVSRRGVNGPRKAVEYFQQVIAIDPGFAPAYAGLADAYGYLSIRTYQGLPFDRALGLMRGAALKALQLNPDLSEAHAAMGIVYARDLRWADSEQQFQQALALNPTLSQVRTSYSMFTLRPLEKFAEAERLLKAAFTNDPLSLDVWREMAQVEFTVGQYDDAIGLLERVRAVDPELPFADLFLARALALRGRVDEALALYDAMEAHGPAGATGTVPPEGGWAPQYRAYAYVRAGRRVDAERLAAQNHSYAYRAALIYAALGDLDRAFDALDRTADREPQRVPLLLTWPELAPLRADPRFAAARKRFGLP